MSGKEQPNPEEFIEALIGMAAMSILARKLRQMHNDEEPDDDNPKEVGDVVRLVKDRRNLAHLYNTEDEPVLIVDHENHTVHNREEAEKLFDHQFVVMDNDANHEYDCQACSHEHVADLVITSRETGKSYYIYSKYVKLINK